MKIKFHSSKFQYVTQLVLCFHAPCVDVFVKDDNACRATYSAVIFRDAVDVDVNTVAYLITNLFAQNSRFIAFEFFFLCVFMPLVLLIST